MRAKRTAAHMLERYGAEAPIHIMYAIASNEGTPAAKFWREVDAELMTLIKGEKPIKGREGTYIHIHKTGEDK